jgi:Divergent InlB B-repeat domain
MKFVSNIARIFGFAYFATQSLYAALIPASSTSTTKVFEEGNEKLTVYTDVPGHSISMINGYASRAKSDIYEIWVKSAASTYPGAPDDGWVQCFANMTYNRGAEMPELSGFGTPTAKHAYQRHTAGWTHTYANIEMSDNSPVEVEIRKIGNTTLDGSVSIVKSAVHPAHKMVPGSKREENGRVYFKIAKPCQMVIDINGQMDDHNTAYPSNEAGGRMPDGSPVHSIAFYANPIMAKPVASSSNTLLTVNASQSTPTTRLIQPDPSTYDTLVFGPGVHNVGPNFKVHPGKGYFIPGDAIIYGNIGNGGVAQGTARSNGDSIKIYGYGTICGIQVPHYQNNTDNPQYPEWNSWTGEKDQGVGIAIDNAWDTKITGVTTIDPANFNTTFGTQSGATNNQNLVSWVKLHSWRVNGDGFGGYSVVEDSFFRTSDDSTYVRNWRRRCTFWKDTNANIFRFVNFKSGGLDDCDVIYARWRDTRGVGSVFEFADGAYEQAEVVDLNLTIRDIRFHDKLSVPTHLFAMETLQSYRGLVFENISAYVPRNGRKSLLKGNQLAPWYERLVFKNVTFKTSNQSQYETGTLLTAANFTTYFETNEFVKYILFDHPRNLTIAITADPVKGVVIKAPNQATHVETTLAQLTAIAEPGYRFMSWSGLDPEDPSNNPTANPITIRMLENRNITANFDLADIADPVVITTPRSGSWVVPEGVYSATIQAWGGGGAGGSAQHTLGSSSISVRGGGGTGGSFSSRTLRVSPGQVINFNVGAGGVGSTLPNGEVFPADSNSGNGSSSSASVNGQNTVLSLGGLGGENKSGATTSVGGVGRTSPVTGNIGDVFYYGGNGAGATGGGSGGGGGSAGAQGSGGNAPSAPAAGIAGLDGGAAGAAGHNGTSVGSVGGISGGGGSGAGVRNSSQAYTLLAGGKGGDGKLVATYNTLNVDFTLTALATAGGSVTGGGIYDAGTIVTVQATPLAGYRFTGWSGGLTGTNNPATFTLRDDTTVTANFIQQYTFDTSFTNGSVTLHPLGGIYDAGTEVTITASADANYRFAGWNGDLTGSTNPLVVVMGSNLSVAANFVRQYTLTTTATNGTITVNPPGGTYDANSVIQLTATPDSGYTFSGWSDVTLGTSSSVNLTMSALRNVTANFISKGEKVPWTVNFDGLPNATTSQALPASWTATRAGGGSFRVLNNRLAVNSNGGEAVFTSGMIDISSGNVNLALTVASQGDLESAKGSAQDYFRLYTKINGGAETLVRQVLGGHSSSTWTANNLSGNTLQIIVRTKVTDSTEFYHLDNVSVVDVPLPSPLLTADIGQVAASGLARVKAGTWTILGSGQDIWGSQDEFRYVYRNTITDCSVIAQVASMTNTNGFAKTGVMIRESTAANSINAMVCATPNEGIIFQWRSATGGVTSRIQVSGLAIPKWLKISRTGDSFEAFYSDDQVTWTQVGTAVTIAMSASATGGVAVTSRNDGVLCTSTLTGMITDP